MLRDLPGTESLAPTRRVVVLTPAAFVLAGVGRVRAQAKRLYRLGLLVSGDQAQLHRSDNFRAELAKLGFVDGANLAIDVRFSDNDRSRLDAAIAELVALKPDVLVVEGGTIAALAAKRATSDIPVVFPFVGDPVGRGVVASLSRPGGNLTGNTAMTMELDFKQVQLLSETIGNGASIGVIVGALPDAAKPEWTRRYAGIFPGGKPSVQVYFVDRPEEIEPLFERISRDRVTAVSISASSFGAQNWPRMLAQIQRYRLAAIGDRREMAQAGLLLAYALDVREVDRSTARHVQKILSGIKPADLPVEQISRVELVINMKTAKALGLRMPPSVLARADEVIE